MEIRIKGDAEDITDIYLLIRRFDPKAPVKIKLMCFGNDDGGASGEPGEPMKRRSL